MKKGTCMLIDVAIPGDRNVIQKEAEKILKHVADSCKFIKYFIKEVALYYTV
jgi:hypothetical protein